jgi:hypothetical protein
MKAYLATTGAIFTLIVVAHVMRIAAEGFGLATDVWWLFLTAASAALAVWAWRLYRLETHRG